VEVGKSTRSAVGIKVRYGARPVRQDILTGHLR